MSLSIENLKEIQAKIIADTNDAIDSFDGAASLLPKRLPVDYSALLSAMAAIRELIAIKEAEPVAWLVHAEHEFVDRQPQIIGGLPRTPLIRKPE